MILCLFMQQSSEKHRREIKQSPLSESLCFFLHYFSQLIVKLEPRKSSSLRKFSVEWSGVERSGKESTAV